MAARSCSAGVSAGLLRLGWPRPLESDPQGSVGCWPRDRWVVETSREPKGPEAQAVQREEVMALTDSWTPEEVARYKNNEENRRQKNRQRCKEYQDRLHREVITKLGGKCVKCGETDPSLLQQDHIDGGGSQHNRKTSWSRRYRAILAGDSRCQLLCVHCNWKKRVDLGEATGRPRLH
jgi:hypothetical protein